jgi:hypothetical protein
MKEVARRLLSTSVTALLALMVLAGCITPAKAQSPDLQQRVADIKAEMANNKRALMSYNWTQQVTISLKGEVKKVQHFQVRLGPDGSQQKTSLDAPPAPPSGGRLKQRVVANKKEEYTDYADSMKDLTDQYVPPNGELLQQAYAKGNIMMGPAAGNPNAVKLVVSNFVKPGDSLTILFDREQKRVLNLQIASYLSSPKDAVSLTVQFSQLPGGVDYAGTVILDGSGKQMNIAMQNMNYQHN